jgi:hypothetical protein
MNATFRAIEFLWEWRLQDGREILAAVESRLPLIEASSASHYHVVARYYHPVLAYYHYCNEDLDTAERCLDRAQESVSAAIGYERFLVPLADICLDFGYQKARIARCRRQWRKMRERIDEVEAMLEDRAPFCILPDGMPIYLRNLLTFYISLPLSERELASLEDLLDLESRTRYFERTRQGLYVQPGFVIPYP